MRREIWSFRPDYDRIYIIWNIITERSPCGRRYSGMKRPVGPERRGIHDEKDAASDYFARGAAGPVPRGRGGAGQRPGRIADRAEWRRTIRRQKINHPNKSANQDAREGRSNRSKRGKRHEAYRKYCAGPDRGCKPYPGRAAGCGGCGRKHAGNRAGCGGKSPRPRPPPGITRSGSAGTKTAITATVPFSGGCCRAAAARTRTTARTCRSAVRGKPC